MENGLLSREVVNKDDFDEKLIEIVGELTPAGLLSIGGVYEVLSEYFNNEIIAELDEDEEEDENDD